jgi:DNA invertase Pin-like site-specific DNA recombinase
MAYANEQRRKSNMAKTRRLTTVIPLDQRDPATVRAVILARTSNMNAKEATLESQVEACEAFIREQGWPQPTLGPFTEKVSGYLDVKRGVFDELERLMADHAIDVVVTLNYERLSRQLERRYYAMYHAKNNKVEYRFVELGGDGKPADDLQSRLVQPLLEVFGEMSRDSIVKNTTRGREKRAADGWPSGGRAKGAPYGFRPAEVGDATRYWAERKDEADVIRAMFN